MPVIPPYSDPIWHKDELDFSEAELWADTWKEDEVLQHFLSSAFSIPARDYNPSSPFVYVQSRSDGRRTTLPHGYRLPLLYVAKYQWETIRKAFADENRLKAWIVEKVEILHLSSVCQNLLKQARIKETEGGGMEKGWRCLFFDRVLTRFYKGRHHSRPSALTAFLSQFTQKEYERDVLKHDWKRWVMKGYSGVKMTEDEVVGGISAFRFTGNLRKEGRSWYMDGRLLDIAEVWTPASSPLTDVDDYEVRPTEVGPTLPQKEEEEEDEETDAATPPFLNPYIQAKRGRVAMGEDEPPVAKRPRLDSVASSGNPNTPPRNPSESTANQVITTYSPHDAQRHNASAGPSSPTSLLSSQNKARPFVEIPPLHTPSPYAKLRFKLPQRAAAPSISALMASASASAPPMPTGPTTTTTKANPTVTVKVAPAKKIPPRDPQHKRVTRLQQRNSREAAGSSASAPVNGAAKGKAKETGSRSAASATPSRSAATRNKGGQATTTGGGGLSDIPQHMLHTKALELLVSMVEVKRDLRQQLGSSSSSGPANVINLSGLDTSPPTDLLQPSVGETVSNPVMESLGKRLQEFEERLVDLKKEWEGLAGRLEILEKVQGEKEVLASSSDHTKETVGVDDDVLMNFDFLAAEDEVAKEKDEAGPTSSDDVAGQNDADGQEIPPEPSPVPNPSQSVNPSTGIEPSAARRSPSSLPESAPVETEAKDSAISPLSLGSVDMRPQSQPPPQPETQGQPPSPTEAELMSSTLGGFIDDLVTTKMLAAMQGLGQRKSAAPSPPIPGGPSMDSILLWSHSLLSGSWTSENYVVATVLDELKAMREETSNREQREKEEMHAMRQLHSAEVDALRRRLSYLESISRQEDRDRDRYRSASSTPLRRQHERDEHAQHRGRHQRPNGNENGLGKSELFTSAPCGTSGSENDTSISPLLRTSEASLESGAGMPTPTPSERGGLVFTKPGLPFAGPGGGGSQGKLDVDDTPLPIKSQRKQHVMAALGRSVGSHSGPS